MPTLTIEPSAAVLLSPKIKTRLKRELAIYEKLDDSYKVAKAARTKQGGILEDIRDETGEQSISLEGLGTVTLVTGSSKKINYKKLIQLGCRAEWIEQATEETPKKAYTKITLPRGSEEDE